MVHFCWDLWTKDKKVYFYENMTINQMNTFKTIRPAPCFDSRQVTLRKELILVIFVLAGTGREMKHHFPLVINQHYFAWRLRSSVTLWSYRSPLYIVMRTERHSPLLPSPHGSLSLSLSLHMTHSWHAASLPSQNTRRTCWGGCGQMIWQIFPPPGLSESQCHL